MKKKYKILIVAYYFPPMGGVGVQRVAKWAQYLPQYNCEVHVLTTKHPQAPLDPALLATLPKQVKIHRTTDIVLRSKPAPEKGEGINSDKKTLHLGGIINTAAQFFLRPNQHVLWKPFALHAAQRLCRQEQFDAIITSAPPQVNHVIGLELQQLTGIPLIADFRDLPEWHPFSVAGTPLHRAHDRHLLRTVLAAADGVIAVSPGMRDQLRRQLPDRRDIAVIPNGFDLSDAQPHKKKHKDRFVVANIGSFDASHPVEPLLAVITAMQKSDPHLHQKVEFLFMGNASRRMRSALLDPRFKKILRYRKFESHEIALQQMRAADALLLHVPNRPFVDGHIPAKTFEYLAAGRPILALAPPQNDAAVIVRRTGAGIVGDSADIAAAAVAFSQAITRLHNGDAIATRNEELIAQYDRKKQTAALFEYIKTILRT